MHFVGDPRTKTFVATVQHIDDAHGNSDAHLEWTTTTLLVLVLLAHGIMHGCRVADLFFTMQENFLAQSDLLMSRDCKQSQDIKAIHGQSVYP